MKAIKKVKYKSGDLILRKNAGLILLVTLVWKYAIRFWGLCGLEAYRCE